MPPAKKQYTIRNVPRSVDLALRKKAEKEGKSLNTLLLEALKKEVGVADEPKIFTDLDFIIGSWVNDAEVDRALFDQRKIDSKDWS